MRSECKYWYMPPKRPFFFFFFLELILLLQSAITPAYTALCMGLLAGETVPRTTATASHFLGGLWLARGPGSTFCMTAGRIPSPCCSQISCHKGKNSSWASSCKAPVSEISWDSCFQQAPFTVTLKALLDMTRSYTPTGQVIEACPLAFLQA